MLWQLGSALALVILLRFAVWCWQNRRIIALSKRIKCDLKSYPFLGHALMYLGGGENRMKAFQMIGREAIKQGGITKTWLGFRSYIVLVDAMDLEVVMKTCLEKDDIMKFPRLIVGNGTIFAPVSIWRPRRKVLAPTFSPKNLYNFVQIFSRQSQVTATQLQTKVGTGPFSVWEYLTSYTMDSVCESALGIKTDVQKGKRPQFLHAFESGYRVVATRMLQPWLHNDAIFMLMPSYRYLKKCIKVILEFIDTIIKVKRKEIEEKNYEGKESSEVKTFLQLLIENSGGDNGFSDVELREETLVIVLAGTDTSAVGASFVMAMMAKQPEVQEKVYQELMSVLGNTRRPVTPEDLPHLKYMDAVIKETLRLYPPVPAIARQIEKDVHIPSGITLVKGCGIFVNIWAIHRNPKYWGENAEQFRPERFIDTPLKHPAAFMAFSYGPRNCLGYQYAMMSMKTSLATILSRYKVLPKDPELDGYNDNTPFNVTFDIMMKDVDRFTVRLENRK